MGSKIRGIRAAQTRVAAHYQVTDLVVRRDWYSVATVFAAGEVSEDDWRGVASLLANVSLDELALFDAQLQLAGISQPKSVRELTKTNERVAVASALELSRRRYYLQQQFALDPLFADGYRRNIEKVLRRAVSYNYDAKNVSMTIRTTHQLLDAIKRGAVSSDEWNDALMVVLRRDPLLLSGLVDDGFVSLHDAGYALDQTPIAPIDAVRLLVALPELITEQRLALFVQRIDLGAIAQLRDEISNGVVRSALNTRATALLAEAVQHEDQASSRYRGVYGDEHDYVTARQDRLRTRIAQLDDESLGALRDFMTLLDTSIQGLRTMPVVRELDLVETVQFVMMLGVRFEWAATYGDQLYAHYAQEWLTESQRIGLLDDESSLVHGRERKKFDHINTRLRAFAMQFTISAHDLLLHAPGLRTYAAKIASGRALHRDDLTILAYVSADDADLRTQVVRRLDERAFSELLNVSIDGSSLARGFWCSLDTADILYLMLRWGSRTRNGYLLRQVASVSAKRYNDLYREAEARRLDVMDTAEIDAVLTVLAQTHEVVSSVSPEQSITFIDQLVKTYGAEQATQFVRAAGIRHAKELTRLSPFYVKLLIDMHNEDSIAERLKGYEETLTYEQAQEVRNEHYKQKQSFASEVVASLQRSLKTEIPTPQQVVTEAV